MTYRKKIASEINFEPEIEIVDHKTSAVVYLEHGFPSDLIRWHHHKEFELHLIVSTSGKMFVGDYIGSFQPGNLVLTGPHLPHNWITHQDEKKAFPIRDRVVQFTSKMFEDSYEIFPETKAVTELLTKAQYGIEFFGIDLDEVEKVFMDVRDAEGLERLSHFFLLMDKLVKWGNYRLLNTLQIESYADEEVIDKINIVVNYLSKYYNEDIELSDAANLLKMNTSYFSRFFHKTTGNRFSDFLNRLRISRACELLIRTNKNISEIGYEVGYNNLSNFNRRFSKFKNMSPSDYRIYVHQRSSRLTKPLSDVGYSP